MTWQDWLATAAHVAMLTCFVALTFLRADLDDIVRERLDRHWGVLRVLRRRVGISDAELARELLADEHDRRTGAGGKP